MLIATVGVRAMSIARRAVALGVAAKRGETNYRGRGHCSGTIRLSVFATASYYQG